MVRRSIFVFVYSFFGALALISNCLAQKPVLEIDSAMNWPTVLQPHISENGKYVSYHFGKGAFMDKLVVKMVGGTWSVTIPGGSDEKFSKNNQVLICVDPEKGLTALWLGSDKLQRVPDVKAYRYFERDGKEYLTYKKPDSTLVICNTFLQTQQEYKQVVDYKVSDGGNFLVLYKRTHGTGGTVELVTLKNLTRKTIWAGVQAGNFLFDNKERQLAFWTGRDSTATVWHYAIGQSLARKLFDNKGTGLTDAHWITAMQYYSFGTDGRQLYFGITPKPIRKNRPGVMLDVWNYKDVLLQSEQQASAGRTEISLAKIDVTGGGFIRLQQEHERVVSYKSFNSGAILIERRAGNLNERHWNPLSAISYEIVNGATGKRIVLKHNTKFYLSTRFSFSEDGKWLVYYDMDSANYMSCALRTGRITNITNKVKTYWEYYYLKMLDQTEMGTPGGIKGWTSDGYVIVGGMYDFWKADPEGRKAPVNITNGVGEKRKIVFKQVEATQTAILPYDRPILLSAFNTQTKEAGFYYLILNRKEKNSMKLLFMGECFFDSRDNAGREYDPTIEYYLAANSKKDAYVVLRQNVDSYPNFYFTRDFKTYLPVSNYAPHRQYNWLSRELHKFKLNNGDSTSGILYKPENFDGSKRYPLIIFYYNRETQKLNTFPMPNFGGQIDIAHFVSNGYLIFTPDINYANSTIRAAALRSIEGAGRYLSGKPYVDAAHIGIHGGSFGGYETNYIAVNSKMFAAAITGCGDSNLISSFGGIDGNTGASTQTMIENGQYHMGCTPWENVNAYVDASPVFWLNRVSMPILIHHNKGDKNVHFEQGIELYTGLRRASKKVWLLQYDNEIHGNHLNEANKKDAEIRYMQFFDHYLKGKPAPKWMTRGIPAKMKVIDDGLELDTEIKTPN